MHNPFMDTIAHVSSQYVKTGLYEDEDIPQSDRLTDLVQTSLSQTYKHEAHVSYIPVKVGTPHMLPLGDSLPRARFTNKLR